jgi:ABC-2 type transport system ATP-binding protein
VTAVRFERADVRFAGKPALAQLSLEVTAGRIYVLLGHNGAGKTTALRAAFGVQRLDAGRALLDGEDAAADPVRSRTLAGLMPDVPALYGHMSGDEVLAFHAAVRGLPDKSWRPRCDDLIDRLQLGGARTIPVGEHSFGMRRKLALVAAMLHGPSHLLLDEPTAGLDPTSVRALRDILSEQAASGAAILVATNDLDAVPAIAHQLGILDRGRLVAELAGDELGALVRRGPAALEKLFLENTGGGAEAARA